MNGKGMTENHSSAVHSLALAGFRSNDSAIQSPQARTIPGLTRARIAKVSLLALRGSEA